jgi:hypothetical protein
MVAQGHSERTPHEHRTFREIRTLIADSNLSAMVKERSWVRR